MFMKLVNFSSPNFTEILNSYDGILFDDFRSDKSAETKVLLLWIIVRFVQNLSITSHYKTSVT